MDLVCLRCGLAGGRGASGGLLDQPNPRCSSARWWRLLSAASCTLLV
jgi:hypothetical protein